jgi:hypothetical protein
MLIHHDGRQDDGRTGQALRNGDLRVCPTRIDHAPVLFAHKVIANQCQDRQRGHYHKCFTCAWNNAWARSHGPPTEAAVERRAFVRIG